MGIAQLNENNKLFLTDVVKKLELDKKLKDEGEIEAKEEDARNLLKLGVSIDIVIKATGLSDKKVMDLKEDLE